MAYQTDLMGLHHNVYRCRDSEQTRQFYEGILGLRLAAGFELEAVKSGRPIKAFHSFYELGDGSFLAFFEIIDKKDNFTFEDKSDFDLHIALMVGNDMTLAKYEELGLANGVDVRGPVDHNICRSIYLRDPNGYAIELACLTETTGELMSHANQVAHEHLEAWQKNKPSKEPYR